MNRKLYIQSKVREEVFKKLHEKSLQRGIEMLCEVKSRDLLLILESNNDDNGPQLPSIELGPDADEAISMITTSLFLLIPGVRFFTPIAAPLAATALRSWFNSYLQTRAPDRDPIGNVEKIVKTFSRLPQVEKTGKGIRNYLLNIHPERTKKPLTNQLIADINNLSDQELGIRYYTIALIDTMNKPAFANILNKSIKSVVTGRGISSLPGKVAMYLGKALFGKQYDPSTKRTKEADRRIDFFVVNPSSFDPVYQELYKVVPTPAEDLYVDIAVRSGSSPVLPELPGFDDEDSFDDISSLERSIRDTQSMSDQYPNVTYNDIASSRQIPSEEERRKQMEYINSVLGYDDEDDISTEEIGLIPIDIVDEWDEDEYSGGFNVSGDLDPTQMEQKPERKKKPSYYRKPL